MKQRKVKGWRREEEKTRKKGALSRTRNNTSGTYDYSITPHDEMITKKETMPAEDINSSGSQKSDAIIELQQSHGNRFIQRMVNSGGEAATLNDELVRQIDAQRGSGQPLVDRVRSQMEAAFAHDFDDVRTHTDSEADVLSQNLNAKAFTAGKDIFFRQGVYEPTSTEGTGIIAHELTHVIQQSGSPSASPERITDISEAAEIQASRIGQAIVSDQNIPIEANVETTGVLARQASEATAPSTSAEVSEEQRIAEEDKLINNFYPKVLVPMYDALQALENEPPNLSLAGSLIWGVRGFLDTGIDLRKLVGSDFFVIVFSLSTNLDHDIGTPLVTIVNNVYPETLSEYNAPDINTIKNMLRLYWNSASRDYRDTLVPTYRGRYR